MFDDIMYVIIDIMYVFVDFNEHYEAVGEFTSSSTPSIHSTR